MRLEFEPNVTAFPLVENELFDDEPTPDSHDFQILLKKGIAAAQAGDRDAARGLLARSTEMEPKSEEAWMWLASISEYPEELLAFLHNVLQINPYNDRALEWHRATESLLAKTLAQRGIDAQGHDSPAQARQFFEQALDHDDMCEMAWFGLAGTASSPDERTECLLRVLDINPGNEEALQALDAIKKEERAAALDNAKKAALSGKHQEAVKIIDEVLEADPSNADTWILKSHLAANLNEKLVSLEKALEIDPENVAARSSYDFLSTCLSPSDHSSGSPDSNDGQVTQPASEHAPQTDLESDRSFDSPGQGSSEPDEVMSESNEVSGMFTDNSLELGSSDSNDQQLSEPVYKDGPETDVDSDAGFDEPAYLEACETDPESDRGFDVATEASFESDDVPTAGDDALIDNDVSEVQLERVTDEFRFDGDSDGEERTDVENSIEIFETEPPTQNGSYSDHMSETPNPTFVEEPHVAAEQYSCPFCKAKNEGNVFECPDCHAVLTLADIEALLSNTKADVEAIQTSVTAMEAEWNLREFNNDELTMLAIGHFNLRDFDVGFKYLQEASRLDPNNVILTGQTNAIAIRLAEMRRQAETPDTSPKGKSILVVDDSATVRKLISGKLEKSGHNVVCAVDGVDGLARLAEALPDLVLLDIGMPRMDGYEVCREIRANPEAKDIPVVMISGKDGFFDKVRGRMAGATGYVTKPFGPETLMKALETYLIPEPAEQEQ